MAACPELTMLAALTGDVAALLTPIDGNDKRLTAWVDQISSDSSLVVPGRALASMSVWTSQRRTVSFTIPSWSATALDTAVIDE